MKKIISLFTAIILFLTLFSGCNRQEEKNQEAKNEYMSFLKKQYQDNDIYFTLKDIDGNGIDELITSKNGTLKVYTFNDEVTEIGEWEFATGTLRLLSSNNSSYPGIIYFYVGWGENIYGYMTVKDNTLSLKKLWIDHYSTESIDSPNRITKISEDQRLIEESKISYNENKDIEFSYLDDID